MATRAAYPGTFNPLTVAHLAIVDAALTQLDVDAVDLVVSRIPLAKEDLDRPLLDDRVDVLRQAATRRDRVGVVVTDHQLLADIADGYDFLIVGADKWHELHDVRFYGSDAARDEALRRLPPLAVVPRPPASLPDHVRILDVPRRITEISSTAVRNGAVDLMSAEAAEFDRRTGAWSDPERYERWLATRPRSS